MANKILNSGLFNEQAYLARYPDVAAGWKGTAEEHFLQYGANEGRIGNTNFDVTYLRSTYADLSGMTAAQLYTWYNQYGYAENRVTSSALASFDAARYLADNADLGKGGVTANSALAHYLMFGVTEGRAAYNTSDVAYTVANGTVSTGTGGNEAGKETVLTIAQDILTGTAGADTFRAVAGAATGAQDQTTLNSSDIIDGGVGADTMIVNLVGGNYNGGARIKNIETLQIGTNDAVARTFDYNVNMGSNEVTGVNTVRYDQINVGENLTVANLTATSTANTIPTLLWDNEAGSTAGTINATFRDSAVAGTTTAVKVQLDDVAALNTNAATGVLNIGAGVETLTITSQGTTANTLNNTTNADTGVNAVAADVISSGSLTKVILEGAQAIGRTAGVVADTGLTDRVAGNDLGITTAATASNLLSVGARVTEVDASTMTGSANVRFTAKNDNSDTNVTFKGGAAADYVEFERGAVNATGGEGNDTFAFVTAAAGITNSGFGSTDTVAGGAGSDTIQIGLNGVGTYTLNTTEFNNKTGIDVLDVRGANNDIRVSSEVVAAADAGKFTIRTDKMVQTSATSTADVTGGSGAEAASTSIINLTALNQNQGIAVIGGSGSERVVVNNASLNAAVELDGGTNGGVAGRYDTLTVLDSAVLDSGDLANVKGFEALILAETVTGNSTFRVDVTEAFLLNNTAATNAVGTSINDTTFRIGSAASSTGTALNAGDVVTIDISDLLNATRTGLKASLAGRGIDVTLGAATVNYVVDGAAATAAQIGFVTVADAARADAGVSAAAGGVVVAPAAPIALTAGGTFTGAAGTNDNFTGNIASLVGTTVTGTAADTETLTVTDAGVVTVAATVTGIDVLNLANGANTVTFAAATSGITTVNGGTGNDNVTVTDALLQPGGAAATVLNLNGGLGLDTLTVNGALDLTNDTVTNFDTLTTTAALTVGSGVALNQFSTITLGAALTVAAGAHNVSTAAVTPGANNITINAGASLTIGGDANVAATANFLGTNAGTLITTGALTLTGASDTITNVTFGQGGVTITDDGALAAGRVFTGSAGVDTLALDATGAAAQSAGRFVGFQVGATGDVIDLSGTGAGNGVVLTTMAAGGSVAGSIGAAANLVSLVALSSAAAQVNGAFSNATVINAITSAGLTGAAAGSLYVALDNGTDTAIYRVLLSGSGASAATIDAADDITSVQQIVTLAGVSDVATLNAANIA